MTPPPLTRRSPARKLLVRAAILVAAYAVAHLAGLRPYATVLSGSAPPSSLSPFAAGALGCSYVVLHFAAIVLAPILAIAAGLLALTNRRREGEEGSAR